MGVVMNIRRTKNAISLEHNALREVDDFDISLNTPKRGETTIIFTLGEYDSVACDLKASSDDFQKLKEWMEAIARDESKPSIALGSGAKLTCELTDIPENAVAKTYRYLDEQFPSPIAVVSVTKENDEIYTAVLKVKHFINLLYVTLLTGVYDYPKSLRRQWYPFTKKYQQEEDFPKWMRRNLYWHHSLLASPLIEWYLQSSESYATATPQFRYEPGCAHVICMWADFGSSIFWDFSNGASLGNHEFLELGDYVFDFSDIEGLNAWYQEFFELAGDFDEIEDDFPEEIREEEIIEERKLATLQKIKEWHIKGFKLAQEIRKRLPLNVILIYEQSWDVAYGLHYFERDKGRIIFDPRKIDKIRTDTPGGQDTLTTSIP